MKQQRFFLVVLCCFVCSLSAIAQDKAGDSTLQKNEFADLFVQTDTGKVIAALPPTSKKQKSKEPKLPDTSFRNHSPRKATLRSLMIPGWGQAYNKEYWKIPVVYAVLAIPTYTFIYNNKWYKRTKTAYELKYAASLSTATPQDIANLANIYPDLVNSSLSSLQTYRNAFRKDRDYSALWFLIVWGLNVADATVFAHLKGFDVSDNLSMQVKPTINPIGNSKGFTIAFHVKQPTYKPAKLP